MGGKKLTFLFRTRSQGTGETTAGSRQGGFKIQKGRETRDGEGTNTKSPTHPAGDEGSGHEQAPGSGKNQVVFQKRTREKKAKKSMGLGE